MSDNSINIRYNLTARDYLKVLIWYQWKRIAVITGLVLIGIMLLALVMTKPTPTEPYKRFPLYFTAVVTPIVVVVASYIGLLRQARKLESISERVDFTASSNGFEVVTSSSTTESKWERMNKVVEINQYFVFFPQGNIFFVVPKQNIEEARNLNAFRSILSDGLGSRARLLN